MKGSLLAFWNQARTPVLCGVGAALLFGQSGSGAAAEPDRISDSSWRQIRALQKEKLTRSAAVLIRPQALGTILNDDSNETFQVNFFGVSNAKIARATGTGMIIKHDGLPGQVDHFAWGPIPSPQLLGQSFPVAITAQDYFNGTASNFDGTVTLSGAAGGGITNSILGDLTHLSSASGTWTLGYAFTPSTDIVVTHVRHYFGSKVSIWTDDGTLLASQNVSSTPGTWVETLLATPVPLTAGNRYRVGAYSDGGTYYWRADGSNSFSNGTINQSCEIAADNFPANADDVHWWLVDLRYVVGSSLSFPISPVISGNFTNGLWNGSVTVLQPASNLVLRADDGSAHTGSSSPFAVALSNDVSIAVVDSPDPVLVGMNLVYALTIANVGPSPATGVIVTNNLPAGATFVSANPSQGTYTQTAGMVTCNLGTIPGGTNATITIGVVPTTGGMTITNRAAVSRAETDPDSPNNSATTITTVTAPALSVNDVSLLEGDAGTGTAIFTVTLAPAGVLPVTVHYATDDDRARAGTDYVATSGTLSFNPGETSKTITVFVNGDTTGEPDETFVVNLSNPTNAIVARVQGIGTILNDDVPSAAYLRSTAGRPWGSDSNETDMNRVFGLNNWRDLRYEQVNVDLLLSSTTTFIFMEGSDNNAAQLENFLAAHIVAIQNWVAGGGSLFLNAAPNQDDGMSFGFGVTLTFPDFTDTAIAAIPTHPIFNGPFTPVASTSWSGYSFGHGTVSGTGLITLIANSSTGRAILGEMIYGTGRVLFGGMTTDNFHIPQPQAANLRANIIAYLSAQPGPAVSIADASVVEGDLGTTNMVFTVTLASPSLQTITVNYAATNGSAGAGSDYIGTNGVLTFAPGITSRTIAVAVVGDNLIETNETFFVNLTYAINATPGRSQAVGTILDDDSLPGKINHFVWDAIPLPRLVGEPFPVTVTAQDYFNSTVTSFTDAVALSIPPGSGQGDDFNRPDGSGLGAIWTQQNSTWRIENNRARSNPGGGNALMTFAAVVPQPVLYADVFYVGAPRVTYGALVSKYTNLANSVFIKLQDNGSSGSFNTVYFLYGNNGSPWPAMTGGSAVVSVAPFTQGRITTRVVGDSITLEIDRNFDSVPEDTITRGGIPLGNLGDRVGLAGFNDATIDNFSVGGPPPAVAPTNSGNFAGGIWTGNIAVLQAGTNVTLWADDGRGHIGQSLPFNVTDAARLSIAHSENSVVLSWPAAAAGFRLEQALLLPAGTNWVPVIDASIIVADRRTVSNSISGSNQFYRLTKP